MKALLIRTMKEDKQTLGELQVADFKCYTLELPDLNNDGIEGNEVRKSCIPDGTYPVVRHTSPKFGKTFWIKNVPGRSAILIHAGNFHRHTLGCVLVGDDHKDVNDDGYLDVVNSKATMKKLLKFDIDEIEVKSI